jgi:hypothetical protein
LKRGRGAADTPLRDLDSRERCVDEAQVVPGTRVFGAELDEPFDGQFPLRDQDDLLPVGAVLDELTATHVVVDRCRKEELPLGEAHDRFEAAQQRQVVDVLGRVAHRHARDHAHHHARHQRYRFRSSHLNEKNPQIGGV